MSSNTMARIPKSELDEHADCRALGQVLDRIGDKWTIMVVGILSKGPMRFNAMMREIGGVSHRMLTLTLRGLERDGLVNRTVFLAIPPKVEYELTDLGRSLIEPLETLAGWGRRNRPKVEAAQEKFDSTSSVKPIAVRSGRPAPSTSTRVRR